METELEARLAPLRERFVARSREDVARLQELLMQGGEAALPPAALEEARMLAHRMVGTGATLGLDAISEAAARLEDLAEQALSAAVVDRAWRGLVHESVAELALKIAPP